MNKHNSYLSLKPNRLALLRFKTKVIFSKCRKVYYQLLGLRIGRKSSIGAVTCDWFSKLMVGDQTEIDHGVHFWLKYPFKKDNYIQIGDRTFVGRNSVLNCNSRIIIGNDCLIANNVTIVDLNHGTNVGSVMRDQPCESEDVIIYNDVWIGAGAVILKGVHIGSGSIVAAGAVVNKSIPDHQIWGGVPARLIRSRI